MSAHEIADEFEVSVRTVYRDIDALSAAGVPVYGESGPGGGFRFHDGYRAGLTGMTGGEASALLLAGFPQAIELFGLGADADLARKKVAAAMAGTLSDKSLVQRIHLDPDPWYRRQARPSHLGAIVDALVAGAQIELEYDSWQKQSRVVVDPLGLVLKAGAWYLVGDRNGRPTTFRVASIKGLAPTGEVAALRADFSLADYWTERCAAFEAGLRREQATVRVSEDALHRLDQLGSAVAEAFEAAPSDADGWRTATIAIENIEQAAVSLLALGERFQVLSPAALRREIARVAQQAAARHAAA